MISFENQHADDTQQIGCTWFEISFEDQHADEMRPIYGVRGKSVQTGMEHLIHLCCASLYFSLLIAPVYKLWRASEERLSTLQLLLRTIRSSS